MKLFVAKLNREVQDDHLVELFSQYGEVAYARVITDRDTGQSKCFGFVQMRDAAAGQAALDALNGHELLGFKMVVKEAEERPREGGGRPPRESNVGRPSDVPRSAPSRFETNRNENSGEFSRHGGGESEASKQARKKMPAKKTKGKGERDIYADGPKPARMKKTKPKNSDWMDDWEDF